MKMIMAFDEDSASVVGHLEEKNNAALAICECCEEDGPLMFYVRPPQLAQNQRLILGTGAFIGLVFQFKDIALKAYELPGELGSGLQGANKSPPRSDRRANLISGA